MVTKNDLIKFEDDIANLFNEAKIKAPIHLSAGNEDAIIELFKQIDKNDWICGAWRTHFACLLKGVTPEELQSRIINGKSMIMCIKKHNIVCSSIVGGIPSIATGIAWGLKLDNSPNKVWCFVGDMSMETGAFHEAYKYSRGHNLPIVWVIEDNGLSVETPTKDVWGIDSNNQSSIIHYKYKNDKFSHAGTGKHVLF